MSDQPTTNNLPPVKDDPRVQALAECVLFAVNGFKDSSVMATKDGSYKMEMWHTWFKRVLTEAGYVVTDPKPPAEKRAKRKKGVGRAEGE